MINSKIEILDCTLRDGSYEVDFQFTPEDTAVISAALETSGIKLIEIGHGLGLNASNMGKGKAPCNDEDYMKSVSKALVSAKWGMFFIPGIGQIDNLRLAADYDMDFIRIGTNVTEVNNAAFIIEQAKKYNMHVSVNLMKSYAVSPEELAELARISYESGADLVYIVDSAGSMLPEDVKKYFEKINEITSIPLGLHCHDNLSLGIANILSAIEFGVRRVDSTLQGLGRGGGNPATEILVAVFEKKGFHTGIHMNLLMDISENLIRPLLHGKGYDSLDITAGYAGFHSSYLKTILKYADQYSVDPRDLIIGVCEEDRIYAPDQLVEKVASNLKKGKGDSLQIAALPQYKFSATKNEKNISISLSDAVIEIANTISAIAKKRRISSVFNIVSTLYPTSNAIISRFIQEHFGYVIGSAEVDNLDQLSEILCSIDGIVDILIIDSDTTPYLAKSLFEYARSNIQKSTILNYKDSDIWVSSVVRQLSAIIDGLYNHQIGVIGVNNLSYKFILNIIEQGAIVLLSGSSQTELLKCRDYIQAASLNGAIPKIFQNSLDAAAQSDVLISFSRGEKVITQELVSAMHGDIIMDAGVGSVSNEAIIYANSKSFRVIRPDMRAAIAAELTSILGTNRIVNELMGYGEINGIPVIAGGIVGSPGDVVVDNITNPTKVVGVADGSGKVLYKNTGEYTERIRLVEEELYKNKILGKHSYR